MSVSSVIRSHPLIEAARRDAETLSRRYCIKPAGNGFILWKRNGSWMAVHNFPSWEAAVDHLTSRLPTIGGEGPRREHT